MKGLFLLIFVFLAVAAGGLFLDMLKQGGGGGPRVACTLEALLCPDGSSVGRVGPLCEFSPCQNQEYFSGRLSSQGGEFSLITPMPFGDSLHGTSYSLPLKFSHISSALSDFIGKEVLVRGDFSFGNTLQVFEIELLQTIESEEVESVQP